MQGGDSRRAGSGRPWRDSGPRSESEKSGVLSEAMTSRDFLSGLIAPVVIIATSLHRDYVPANWAYFKPTWVDIWQFIGTFGLFLTLFLLFIRFLPVIAISEIKGIMPAADPHGQPAARPHPRARGSPTRARWV